jgi:hypothetical protein
MKRQYLPLPQHILAISDEYAKESCNNQPNGIRTQGELKKRGGNMQIATCSNLISAHYNIKQQYLPQPQPILVSSVEYKDESCNNQLSGMKINGEMEKMVQKACDYLF